MSLGCQQAGGKEQRIARQDQSKQETGIGTHDQNNAEVAHGASQSRKIDRE
jgi:hypothetical protein